ncbi:MAG: 50S ribosomal protein L22 [Actinobacteria bacterium]|nr:50S ribosomal protein L22 [Actinomycetota bacterium]
MEAKAVEKFIRISPRKLRYVADIIRSKRVDEAVDILKFTPKKAAAIIRKAVQSAAANATENNKMKEDDLVIEKVFINEGPVLKRFRPRARGRASKIRKRTSHLTVIVSDGREEEAKGNGSKG